MGHRSALSEEWERLKGLADVKRRGYGFESLVGSFFREAHFTVILNAGAAGSRQVDLMATRYDQTYLVETKWWHKRPSVNEVASLQDRLRRTPPSVIGLLVSYSGFTQGAIDRVESSADRPILLMCGNELERAITGDNDFMHMLRQKENNMRTHGIVVFMASRPYRSSGRHKDTLPTSAGTIVLDNGTRSQWLTCAGRFGQFVFLQELPDIDWKPGSGYGISLDATVRTPDEKALLALLQELANMGWVTHQARWSIQQAATNWHGTGAKPFAEVLSDWRSRYEGLDQVHHSEEFCYIDVCGDIGFYSLTGQVAASTSRDVGRTHCRSR